METENKTWFKFPKGGKAIVQQFTVRDPSRKVKHLSKVIWDGKIITEFTRKINVT